ncbi:hypothetical protein IFM89_008093 [Coptis chinensis]|uniref:UDP-glycosyltransferase n=1 Tax=Coptis chinensis TaxID=261450 RepID=A0A835IS87_9MAGN|nr:hypothetical protein IFM89_008093 [Coptis chinensis]
MTIINDQPHVLVIPYPAQGHVMPLMRLSNCLVERGFRITFVITEFIHDRLINALPEKGKELVGINLVTISEFTLDERKDQNKSDDAVYSNLPAELEKLIKVNESSDSGKIACVIADETLAWALDVAKRMGIRRASFIPVAAGVKAFVYHIPKLIESGVIDENGTTKIKEETVMWSPNMPSLKTAHFMWNCMAGLVSPEIMFQTVIDANKSSKSAEWVLCNTFEELEPAALALVRNLLPIGPLLSTNQVGNLWPEDSTCLSWLDQQATRSVVYVAFGSIAIFNQRQFDELALGLELLGRPFLWVFRSQSDLFGRPTTTFPDGFQDRVAQIGKIVAWAPQQKVLAHPSIACFVTHCGWNSTVEGVSMGVPFLCWPHFADQLFDGDYITDTWRVGLGLNPDEDGIISKDEIKRKSNQLLQSAEIRENALKLKEMAMKSVGKGGSSSKNLELFLEELKT